MTVIKTIIRLIVLICITYGTIKDLISVGDYWIIIILMQIENTLDKNKKS